MAYTFSCVTLPSHTGKKPSTTSGLTALASFSAFSGEGVTSALLAISAGAWVGTCVGISVGRAVGVAVGCGVGVSVG